jgi:hypothetical protein
LSLFVREAPDPKSFNWEATIDLRRARKIHERRFVAFAQHNDRIHAAKSALFIFALTIYSLRHLSQPSERC